MDDKTERIQNSTLSDLEDAAELCRRRAKFAANSDLLPELRSRGIAILDAAINTDLPAALRAHQPLVLLLRRTIEAIGAVYYEDQRRSACLTAMGEATNQKGGAQVSDHEVDDEAKPSLIDATPCEPIKLGEEESAKVSKIQAAIAARRKRRLLTHGKIRATADATNVLKPIHGTQIARPPRLISSTSPVSKRTAGSKLTLAQSTTKPSLTVKLHVPRFFEQQAQHAEKGKRSYKGHKRAHRGKIKPEEFSTDNAEEDVDMQHADEDVETQNSSLDEGRRRSMRSSTRSTATRNSTTSRQPRDSPTGGGIWDSSAASTDNSQTSSSTSDLSTPPSDIDPDASPNPATSSKDKRPARSITSSSSTLPTNSCPSSYAFPAFPPLKRERRSPFHLGATIALENILEDHAENPDETLRELIDELEENRPVFSKEDWEHRSVLKGGGWVYEALRKVVEDGGKKGKGRKMVKGKSTENPYGDDEIVLMVKELGDWVEKEWVRIGGRRAAEEAAEEERRRRERNREEAGDEEDEEEGEAEMSMYHRDLDSD